MSVRYGIPVPSLRTDHVSADDMRRVNYWYRQSALLPMERIPGFAFHQTERSAPPDGTAVDVCSNQSAGGFAGCYRRDFDLLGYKYSLLAQTATAGLNAVFTMLPARDEREFAFFPAEDVAFIRRWLAFGDARMEQLRNTQPLAGADEVLLGRVDGTAALAAPLSCALAEAAAAATGGGGGGGALASGGELGHVFLFNPGYAAANATVVLDDGLSPWDECLRAAAAKGGVMGTGTGTGTGTAAAQIVVTELYPQEGRVLAVRELGGSVVVAMDGSSATVLELSLSSPAAQPPPPPLPPLSLSLSLHRGRPLPLVLAGAAGRATVDAQGVVTVAGLRGEAGSRAELSVLVPASLPWPTAVRVSGQQQQQQQQQQQGQQQQQQQQQQPLLSFPPEPEGRSRAAAAITVPATIGHARFAGSRFPHAAEVPLAPHGAAGCFNASVAVPAPVLEQLAARAKAYPIPWTVQDDDASWLRPERLLLFMSMNCSSNKSVACDDTMNVSLALGGRALPPLMGYNSRCASCNAVNRPFQRNPSKRFAGFYWDLSFVEAEVQHALLFCMPATKVADLQGLFFENTLPIITTAVRVE